MFNSPDIVDGLRSDKATAEQQLSDFRERFNAVQRDFTSLLQEKVEDIRKQFEAKHQVPMALLNIVNVVSNIVCGRRRVSPFCGHETMLTAKSYIIYIVYLVGIDRRPSMVGFVV